ncbi:MAG: hypothetical protein ACE5R4_08920 [Armatimonadota bacterium]
MPGALSTRGLFANDAPLAETDTPDSAFYREMQEEPHPGPEQDETSPWRAVVIALWIVGITASFAACGYVHDVWLATLEGVAF